MSLNIIPGFGKSGISRISDWASSSLMPGEMIPAGEAGGAGSTVARRADEGMGRSQ